MKKKWKRYVRKLPDDFIARAEAAGDTIKVGCVKAISLEDLESGLYDHLGFKFKDDTLLISPQILPSKAQGSWSRKNCVGWWEKHKHLPMEDFTVEFEAPNFGDWSKGSHSVSQDRKRYQKTFHHPLRLNIDMETLGRENQDYLVLFLIDRPIEVGKPGWKDELFFAVNLLLENTGDFDVYSSDATLQDFLAKITVAWKIFPAEDGENAIQFFIGNNPKMKADTVEQVKERVDVLQSLKPLQLVVGDGGFHNYFGAVISDDLVVFENSYYGNAIYIMDQRWKTLTQKSRSELRTSHLTDFTRIPHTRGWKERLRREVQKRLA